MWIDAHCHLTHPNLQNLDEQIQVCRASSIGGWILGGTDPDDWIRQRALKARFPGAVRTAFGLHPWWVAEAKESTITAAFERLKVELLKADALGELGLDSLRPQIELQTQAFEWQLKLARQIQKPLVLHIVRAHPEALKLLDAHGPFNQGGLVHAYSSDLATAKAYIDRGFLISVGKGVLSQGYKTLKATVKDLPASHLVVETDAPDGTSLTQLLEVAQAVGALQNRPAQTVLDTSTDALRRLFSWK